MAGRSEQPEQKERRVDSLSAAILAGFVATGLMTVILSVSYTTALAVGSPSPQAPAWRNWMWGLANNPIADSTQTAIPLAVGIHFITGMVTALAYATVVEPRLRGPGWWRGMVFSLVPWVLSVTVFLPALGGGPFGLRLGAGPLPILGNLILHLAYGVALGQLYGPWGKRFQTETGQPGDRFDELSLLHGQRAIAIGVVAGLVVGAVMGWLGHVALGLGTRPLMALVLGAIGGSTAGAFVGSFLGLSPLEPTPKS